MLTLARRLRSEDGNVLVIAVMMMTLMLVLGSTALSTVDTQTDVTKRERQHESSFNLAEGILHAQTFVLARLGTGSSANEFPDQCTELSTESLCPEDAQLDLSYDDAVQGDYDASTTWRTSVRDNPDEDFYSQAAVDAAAHYDANDDKQLWVKAEAAVRGRTRTIVALIKVEFRSVSFPRYALAGGWFETSNNGRKVIVDSTGSLGVAVRCSEAPPSESCLDYDPSKGQLEPAGSYELDYPTTSTGVLADELQSLEDFAKANGTYYTSCPTDPNGLVVVVESGACSYNNSSPAAPGQSKCCNSAAEPGVYIMKCGSVSFSGNIEYHGIVYVPNKASSDSTTWCSSGVVVETQGTSLITGGVIIDGPGGMLAGSSGMNIQFDPWAFDKVKVAGTAGVVQNTWREIPDDN
ncbi:MAG: hypothetical protein WD993_02270 [Thermoleophilaceae bacterium]